VPLPNRFWENPAKAPAHLDLLSNDVDWLSHNTRRASKINKVRKNGLLSYVHSLELGLPAPEKSTAKDDYVYTYPVLRPDGTTMIFDSRASTIGGIRLLISPKNLAIIYDEHGAAKIKKFVPPDNVAAIIIPSSKTEYTHGWGLTPEQWFKRIIDSAKVAGIPVYLNTGKRIWPPIGILSTMALPLTRLRNAQRVKTKRSA